jgi:hypothetical protein
MNSTSKINLNILQELLKRPKTLGNVYFDYEIGKVNVYYIFYIY